ncbi:MAG TPA: Hsp20/alpha crystallin family protein [Candidatus Acidoferrum sp.]|nr:Hsp20/alpha crystallin family protein [Candidatus Acidoferrum sp.]
MTEKKKPVENETTSKKTELAITKKKTATIAKSPKKQIALAPTSTSDLYEAFDETFERFRNDFEDLLFPSTWANTLSLMPETRVPTMDLEDRGKDFLIKAEMPGFKKENIEIDVQDNFVVITGEAGWKYDKKEHEYLCKERACKTFYRTIDLPEEIKVDDVTANLTDGILEISLPKKIPKEKRKVKVT